MKKQQRDGGSTQLSRLLGWIRELRGLYNRTTVNCWYCTIQLMLVCWELNILYIILNQGLSIHSPVIFFIIIEESQKYHPKNYLKNKTKHGKLIMFFQENLSLSTGLFFNFATSLNKFLLRKKSSNAFFFTWQFQVFAFVLFSCCCYCSCLGTWYVSNYVNN